MAQGPRVAAGPPSDAARELAAGNHRAAVAAAEQALKRRPDDPAMLTVLGRALQAGRRFGEAERAFARVLAVAPGHAEAAFNLAALAHQRRDHVAAAGHAARALKGQPKNAIAAHIRAVSLHDLGRFAEAEAAYRQALAIEPVRPETRSRWANFLRALGRFEEAEAAHRAALAERPDTPEILNNLATVIMQLPGRRRESIELLDKAIALRPEYFSAHYNKGVALSLLSDHDGALDAFRRAHAIRPTDGNASNNLLFNLMQACAWDEADTVGPLVDQQTAAAIAQGRAPAETPFLNIARSDDPAENLRVAQAWSDDIARRFPPRFDHAARRQASGGNRPLVVGYLSHDFRDHPVGHLVRRMFALHDRRHVRVNVYSYGPGDRHGIQKAIAEGADSFAEIRDLGHAAAADRIHADGVDILVELTGWTAQHRHEIVAQRPAPVQIAFLGYPGTSGAACYDYVVVDRTVAPDGEARWFREKRLIMPHTYMPTDDTAPLPGVVPDRAALGLPPAGKVLASFNQPLKIDRTVFACWMRLLAAAPGSVLWLAQAQRAAQASLRAAATAHGVDPARLVFARRLPDKAAHMARFHHVDLALDTARYNGHTTTIDALWAGVPVIVAQGRHFASRVSAGLVAAAGAPELVTGDLTAYEALALRLLRDDGARLALRARLAASRATSPLFDSAGFVGALERGYAAAWGVWRSGLPAGDIDTGPAYGRLA
ncbi:MAG: tetratricopeptide repeat protein [Alphaproteobacteria bacterium]